MRLQWETNSSAVAERPRDVSCLSVSFSNTVYAYVERNRVGLVPIDYFCFRFTIATLRTVKSNYSNILSKQV